MPHDIVDIVRDALALGRGGRVLQAVLGVGKRADQLALPAKDAADEQCDQPAGGEEDETLALTAVTPLATDVHDWDDDRARRGRHYLCCERFRPGGYPRERQESEEDRAGGVVDCDQHAGNSDPDDEHRPRSHPNVAGQKSPWEQGQDEADDQAGREGGRREDEERGHQGGQREGEPHRDRAAPRSQAWVFHRPRVQPAQSPKHRPWVPADPSRSTGSEPTHRPCETTSGPMWRAVAQPDDAGANHSTARRLLCSHDSVVSQFEDVAWCSP